MSEELTPQARALLAASDPSLDLPPDVHDRVRKRLAATLAGDGAVAPPAKLRPKRTSPPGESDDDVVVTPARGRRWAIGAVLAAAALLLLWQGPRVLESIEAREDASAASHVRDGTDARGGSATRRGGDAREVGEPSAHGKPDARKRRPGPPATPADDDIASPPPEAEEPAADAPRQPERPRPRKSAGGAAESTPPVPSLTAELRSLEAVQSTLRSGSASAALKAIRAHRKTFAKGSLHQEAEALEIIARCKAGQHERGRRDARAFLDAHPGSALASRVAAACPEEAP